MNDFLRVSFQSFARIIYMTTYEVYVCMVKNTLQYLQKPLTKKKHISPDIVKAANLDQIYWSFDLSDVDFLLAHNLNLTCLGKNAS